MVALNLNAKIDRLRKKTDQQKIREYALPENVSLSSLLSNYSVNCLDARRLSGFFLPAIVAKARLLKSRQVLLVKQNFEPAPLYAVLGKMGFLYRTRKIDDHYESYFIKQNDILSLK